MTAPVLLSAAFQAELRAFAAIATATGEKARADRAELKRIIGTFAIMELIPQLQERAMLPAPEVST